MVATSRYQCDCNTMMGFNCLFVLAAVIHVISCQEFGQGPPPQGFPNHRCSGPPPNVKKPQDCCLVKPIYSEEVMAECGFQKIDDENSRQQGPPDCRKPECLLDKYNLLNPDKSIKYDELRGKMDEWVSKNQEFEGPMKIAKSVCMGEAGPPGPPQICEPNRLMFCTGAVLFSECPTWQDTEDCKLLKEHMDECRGQNFPPPN